MSSLIGAHTDRLSLRAAQSALAEAARSAAAPSTMWIAGIVYPSLGMVLNVGWAATLGRHKHWELSVSSILWPLFFPFLFRWIAGVARLSSPEAWAEIRAAGRKPSLTDAWQAGRGLMGASLGLWALVVALESVVVFSSFGLFMSLGQHPVLWIAYLLVGPLLLLCAGYALVLSVLYQLALHSLVANRRGIVSALQHAWRLVRNDPWSAVRATIVDLGMSAAVLALVGLVPFVSVAALCFYGIAVPALLFVLFGISGAARAGYWARVYLALGGLAVAPATAEHEEATGPAHLPSPGA